MHGYSKIKTICTKKTRLVDLLDQLSPPQTPMSIPDHSSQSQSSKHIQINIDTTNTDPQDSFLDFGRGHEEDDDGETFGVILSRSHSSLSTSCHGLRACKQNSPLESLVRKTFSMRVEKQNSVLESAVRRAFSMRASPLVSEAYRRIDDDQSDLVADEENLLAPHTASNKKRNRIFETCRRLFGF